MASRYVAPYFAINSLATSPSLVVNRGLNKTSREGGTICRLDASYHAERGLQTKPPKPGSMTQSLSQNMPGKTLTTSSKVNGVTWRSESMGVR